MCANNEAGANIYIPSRFAAPLPPLRLGDEVLVWVLPLAGSPALPEIRTDDDVLVMIVPPCTAPTVTRQPVGRGLCPTDSGLFTVDASGTAPTFRWQWQPGGVGTEFVNIPQGTINNADGRPCFIVEGVSTASLRITRILDEHYRKVINLRCAVQNTCGSATSNTAQFDMLAKPLLSTQPQSTNTCGSSEAVFSVADTSGNPTPSTCQWQWRTFGNADWVNMVDGLNTDPATGEPAFTATGSRQIIAGTTSVAGSGGPRREFHAVVTNSCGSVTSNPATLTICIGDFNCDGGVDGDDVGAFFTQWEGGEAAADVNADGGVDGADVSTFFERWEAGC